MSVLDTDDTVNFTQRMVPFQTEKSTGRSLEKQITAPCSKTFPFILPPLWPAPTRLSIVHLSLLHLLPLLLALVF